MGLNNGFLNTDKRTVLDGHYGPQKYYLNTPGYVLDLVSNTGLVLAVDRRKVRGAYKGYCDLVRRTSDGTQSYIGFVNEAYNSSSYNSFMSGSGYEVTWYDQSGAGRDFVQTATQAYQPQLTASGVNNTIGNIIVPKGVSSTSTNIPTASSSILTGTNVTIIMVLSVGTNNGYGRWLAGRSASNSTDNSGGGFNLNEANASNTIAFEGGTNNYVIAGNATGTVAAGNHVVSVYTTSSTATIRVDGGMSTTQSFTTNFNVNLLTLFATTGGSSAINQKIGACYIFNRTLTLTEIQFIEKNLGGYYGITVS